MEYRYIPAQMLGFAFRSPQPTRAGYAMRRYVCALLFFSSTLLGADLSWNTPWESTLSGLPVEAKDRIRMLCHEVAQEKIYGEINAVDSVMVVLADADAPASVSIPERMSGISYTYLPYMYLRLGLSSVEFDAKYAAEANAENYPIAVFDAKTQNISFSPKATSTVEVVFNRASTQSDHLLGIYGRTIKVKASNGVVLGERTEFFWFHDHRNDPRGGVRKRGAICPSFTMRKQSQPLTFFGQIINPSVYRCLNDYILNTHIARTEYDKERLNVLQTVTGYAAGERLTKDLYRRNKHIEDSLLRELSDCQNQYFLTKQSTEPHWILYPIP